MFDVDKLYIMLPEFRVNEYDYGKAKDDFFKEQSTVKEFASFFKDKSIMSDIAETPIKFKEWFENNKENYKYDTPRIRKVQYDYDKTPQENSLAARNNALIDLIWGVLTNSDTASKILNPGGFDYHKKAARIVSILQSSNKNSLLSELNITDNSIIDKLSSMSLEELNSLADKSKKKLDPLSPETQVILHQQNMTGAKMIGIYANHNANHALVQHTDLSVNENGVFTLNGKTFTSLHNMMNDNKEFISRNNAGFLAASVDNVKDPILAALNQNTLTADASMFLSRLGYNPIEIGLLMNQPIIIDITKSYFRNNRNGANKESIIKDILKEYQKNAQITKNDSYDNYKDNKFTIEELSNNILDSNDKEHNVDYYKKQVAVGQLFSRIMKDSDALGQLVQAMRADTPNGAAGPSIANTVIKIQKLEDLLEDSNWDESFPLSGVDLIDSDIEYDGDLEKLRTQILSSKLPFLQAFYTLGVKQTENMLSKYFPQFSKPFNYVINRLRNMTKIERLDAKTMNSIYNDLFAYILTKTEFFGAEKSGNKIITSFDKRNEFINTFPSYFKKIVNENPDIANLEFIKRLKVVKSNNRGPSDILTFKNVGHLSSTLKERYMRDWASLLYMNNPKAQELALNLFRYNFFRNGLAFGPSTFSHLAPTAVKMVIPEYVSTLRDLLTKEDDYKEFVNQYIYNHLNNRKFVPEIPDKTSVSFTDNKGNIKDEVTFSINDNSSSEDYKVVRKRYVSPSEISYDFFKYITKKVKGENIYYRLDEDFNNTATYRRINPLGLENSFIEYQYGKNAEDMTSVIGNKKADTTNKSNETDSYDSYEEDSLAEYSSDSYMSSGIEAILDAAYSSIYNEHLEEKSKDNDVTSLNPNTEFKDANDEIICGSSIIKSY